VFEDRRPNQLDEMLDWHSKVVQQGTRCDLPQVTDASCGPIPGDKDIEDVMRSDPRRYWSGAEVQAELYEITEREATRAQALPASLPAPQNPGRDAARIKEIHRTVRITDPPQPAHFPSPSPASRHDG